MTGSGEPMDVTQQETDEVIRDDRGDTGRMSMHVESRPDAAPETEREVVFQAKDVSVYYGGFRAIRNIDLPVYEHEIVALIGPSGCGKTTFLRCLNRMNDLIEGARV